MPINVPEWLNILLLGAILCTAVFTIFKAGGWFHGVVGAIDTMGKTLADLKRAFDKHTDEEMIRFERIETEMVDRKRSYERAYEKLNTKIEKLTIQMQVANGALSKE